MPSDTLSDIVVGYSPTDFFYVDAQTKNFMKPDSCTSDIMNLDGNACTTHFVDNSYNCIMKELCLNKQYAESISSVQSGHNGADEKYSNAKTIFDKTVTNTINLGIGIVVMVVLIYRNRNIS